MKTSRVMVNLKWAIRLGSVILIITGAKLAVGRRRLVGTSRVWDRRFRLSPCALSGFLAGNVLTFDWR
jgi:hypothetical protein